MDQLNRPTAPFAGFFDDAAVFPPGRAELGDAVRSHLERRRTPLGDLVGPLLLTAADVPDAGRLAQQMAGASDTDLREEPLRIGLVVAPDGLGAARRISEDPPAGVEVTGLEVKTDQRWREQVTAAVQAAQVAPCGVHVELSAAAVRAGGAGLLQGSGARLKIRTGGLEAALFPTTDQLAGVVHTAVAEGVAFKLTAGLHQAVRHLGVGTGFQHHGFLNIAVATAAARHGAAHPDVARVLALEDAADLVGAFRALGGDWRASFESFGTCSVVECVESLVAVDLLEASLLPEPAGGRR